MLAGCSKEETSGPNETTTSVTPGGSGVVPENEVDGPQLTLPQEEVAPEDAAAVEKTYESFISFLFSMDPNVVKDALSTVYLTDDSTDADREVFIQACLDVNPQAWALVDLSDFDDTKTRASYVEALAYTTIGAVTGPGQYTADLDPSKIVFSSPTQASVPSSAITMFFNGAAQPIEEFGEDINFIKKDGTWFIQAGFTDNYMEES